MDQKIIYIGAAVAGVAILMNRKKADSPQQKSQLPKLNQPKKIVDNPKDTQLTPVGGPKVKDPKGELTGNLQPVQENSFLAGDNISDNANFIVKLLEGEGGVVEETKANLKIGLKAKLSLQNISSKTIKLNELILHESNYNVNHKIGFDEIIFSPNETAEINLTTPIWVNRKPKNSAFQPPVEINVDKLLANLYTRITLFSYNFIN